tara:strand:+ start:3453 stop:3650 length:198 start_codon:yes stop_codon:yes gene_type:complete
MDPSQPATSIIDDKQKDESSFIIGNQKQQNDNASNNKINVNIPRVLTSNGDAHDVEPPAATSNDL